jgi:flavin reductase (DIM6/NTAB) family NADH-FMN oxidoreductase RutF
VSVGAPQGLHPEAFRHVIGHFASGVTVITTRDGEVPLGTTASALSSLSLEPPTLLVCMNTASITGQAIAASGGFAVNILSEDQKEAALTFARKGEDKFRSISWTPGATGMPLLSGALATLECRVLEQVSGGTHSVFVARVEEAAAHAGAPLAYFRGRFAQLSLVQDERPPAQAR